MSDVFLYLIIYSFLGWCCECVYCSFGLGEWINRGFLTGPFCPIYGFGAVATLLLLQYLPGRAFAVFFGGMLITSTLEYITSWIMEKLFNARWWDYSERPFNFHGRVCLLNSTLFGLLCLFLYFDLHPPIHSLVAWFSHDFKLGFLFAFCLYFVADLCLSVKSAFGINVRLKALAQLREQILVKYVELDAKLELSQLEEKLLNLNIRDELLEKLQSKQKSIGFFERRMMKSFPEMVNKSYPERLDELKKGLKNLKKSAY